MRIVARDGRAGRSSAGVLKAAAAAGAHRVPPQLGEGQAAGPPGLHDVGGGMVRLASLNPTAYHGPLS